MTTPPEEGAGDLPASHDPFAPGGGEILSSYDGTVLPTESAGRRRRGVVPLLLAIVLLLVGGGAYVAYAKILKPNGASPEEATPANAMAFAKVDLDPSPSQKLAVYRLAKRFPKTKVHDDSSVSDDLLRAVFRSGFDTVDYDKDIKPWIGKRAAIAAIPDGAGQEPHPLIVVQLDDEKKARASLDRLTKKANAEAPDDPIYFAMSDVDGYAVLSDTQEATNAAARVKHHLDEEKAYVDAVKALQGDQIVTAWADAARVFAAVPKDDLRDNPFFSVDDLKPAGQIVVGAHAESDVVEVVGRTLGLTSGIASFDRARAGLTPGSNMVQSFPDSSVVAFSETGLGETLASLFKENEKALRELDDTFELGVFDMLKEAGVSLPGDFVTVLGSEVAAFFSGTEDDPHLALRVKTSRPDRAKRVLSNVVEQVAGEPVPLDDFFATVPGGYVIGGPDGADARRLATGGHLGTSKAFKDAVPDADRAPFVLFVDVGQVADLSGDEVPEEVRQLKAVGISGRSVGNDSTFRMRLTFR